MADRVTTVPPAVPFLVLNALLETDMGNDSAHFDELPGAPLDLALERLASITLFMDLTEDALVAIRDRSFLLLRTTGMVRRYHGRFIIGREFRLNGAHTNLDDAAANFYTAFPMILGELQDPESDVETAADLARLTFQVGVVVYFWGTLGLIEDLGPDVDAWIRPHPVLQELLAFPATWRGIQSS